MPSENICLALRAWHLYRRSSWMARRVQLCTLNFMVNFCMDNLGFRRWPRATPGDPYTFSECWINPASLSRELKIHSQSLRTLRRTPAGSVGFGNWKKSTISFVVQSQRRATMIAVRRSSSEDVPAYFVVDRTRLKPKP